MRFLRRTKSGFTLIEIMIVVLIIAILLAVAIPNFLKAKENARAKTCQANMRAIDTAKEHWAMEQNVDDSAEPTDAELITEYMRARYEDKLPACPSGGDYTIGNVATIPECSIGANTAAGTDDHVIH